MDSTTPIYLVWNLIEGSPKVRIHNTHISLVVYLANLVVLLCWWRLGVYTLERTVNLCNTL